MSGPLSSNEIEDVVSSVRRLVSVDARPRPVTRDLAQDRLVLTPALRIVPEAANSPLLLTTQVRDSEVAEAIGAGVPAEVDMVSATGSAGVHTYEADWEEELWAEPDAPLAELALEAEEAELLSEGRAEGAVEGPSAGTTQDGMSVWPKLLQGRPDDDAGPEDDAGSGAAEGGLGAEDRGTTFEVLAAGNEPDADGPSEDTAVAQIALDVAEDGTLTDSDGNPLTVLDEAALHQVIRNLIHEELKGALGERITQNVRKLVRAEINRALAAHSLD